MNFKLTLLIYQAAYGCLLPFLAILILKRADLRKRFLHMLGKIKPENRPLPNNKIDCDWFHAVSYGETVLALHNISYALNNNLINKPILFTSTIQNALEKAQAYMQKEHQKVEFYALLLPFDFYFSIKAIFKYFKPKRYFLIETDFWPMKLYLLKEAKLFLINGRISPKLKKLIDFSPSLLKTSLNNFTILFLQEELGFKNTYLVGQMKVDLIKTVTQSEKFLELQLNLPLFVFASFHLNEIEQLLPMLKAAFNKAIIALIPRNINDSKSFSEILSKHKLNNLIIKEKYSTNNRNNILIISQMGVLNALYSQASLAVIGGTFANFGGHNFLEAIAFKKPVILGSDLRNFSIIAKNFTDNRQIIKVNTGKEGALAIEAYFNNPKPFVEMSIKAWHNLKGMQGITEKTWALIKQKS